MRQVNIIAPDKAIRKGTDTSFALDVLEGLSQYPKRISSQYLYDDAGSRLFGRITQLEEYYLTRCELEVLERSGGDLARLLPRDEPFNLIELGAGDGVKTSVILGQFLDAGLKFEYFPVDVSEEAMRCLMGNCGNYAGGRLSVTGVVGEYFDALGRIGGIDGRMNLILFLGSSIGNFDCGAALRFLRRLWNSLNPGDLALIGFDLKKDIAVLERAYNDPQGVTAEFNLNLLDRINAELGGDFRRDKFIFHSRYNVTLGAVESMLVSTRPQDVHVKELSRTFHFEEYEGIHTEWSHKYLLGDIGEIAEKTGFAVIKNFLDTRGYFADSLWRVGKS